MASQTDSFFSAYWPPVYKSAVVASTLLQSRRMTDAVDNGSVYGAEGGERLESSLQRTTDQIVDPWCDLCYDETGQETDAVGFCTECNSFFCHSCIKAHVKMPTLRNHLIKRGARMPACQSEKPVKYLDCTTHVGQVYDQFCLVHGIMKCSQCIEDTHLLCGAGAISDLCKTIESEDFLNLREIVRCIHSISASTKATIERNINDIKNGRNQTTKEVEDVRDKIIAQVKEQSSEIITNINSISDHNLSALSEHVVLLSDIKHCLDKTLSEIDKKTNTKCEPNLFIRMQEIVGYVAHCKNELENMKKQMKTHVLSFSPSAEVSALTLGNSQFWELKDEIKQIEILIPTIDIAFPKPLGLTFAEKTGTLPTHDVSPTSAIKSGNINFRFAEDQKNCDINGIDVTNNGAILVSDFANKKIKAVSKDNELLSSLSFSASPDDISILNRLTAAVGTSDGKLHMINISDLTAMSFVKTIDLGYRISGPFVYNRNLITVRWDKKEPSVKMLAVDGKDVWSISMDTTGKRLFKNPFSVSHSTITNRGTIVVTNLGSNTLTLLDASSGQLLRTMNVKEDGPFGITVDTYGNVYVCFYFSKEIFVWSDDLKRSKILLSSANLKGHPRTISYRSSTNCLFISYSNAETVDCFQLLYN